MMADNRAYASLDDWIASRPPAIRALAKRFPVGDIFLINGVGHFLIGYAESEKPGDEMLIVSPIDPTDDYEAAMAAKVHVCAKHFR